MYQYLKIFSLLIILSGFSFPQDLIFNQPKIAILYSGLTEKYNNANSVSVIEVITTWELFLMQDKIPYKVIYDEDLESGIDDKFDILILPSVNVISNDEKEELRKFLAVGKSIICSGSKLLFQENNFNEYQNLKTLFGLSNVESVSSESICYLHSIVPNHLNQFSLESKSILQISTKSQPLFVDVIENQISACGYLFSENNFDSKKSSIIYGMVGNGKFLWTGFDLPDVIGGQADLKAFKSLILNSISWMDNKPDTYITNFSDSLSSPVIMTLQYNNALESELIDVLQKNNINPHLIISPNQIVSKEMLSKFSGDAIILDLSQNNTLTSNNVKELTDNFNRDYEVSLTSILIAKQFLDSIDLNSIQSIGIDKILYNERVPGLPKFVNNDLLIIPFVKSDAIPGSGDAVNFLNYNPKINCEVNPEGELLEKINQIKSQQYNFTSLASLKKWWRVREKITSEIKNISDSEIELWVSNKSSVAVSNLNVFLNYVGIIDRKTLTISLNNSLLDYSIDNNSDAIVITLENIRPISVNKIKIKFALE